MIVYTAVPHGARSSATLVHKHDNMRVTAGVLTWDRQAMTPKKVWQDSGENPLTLMES